MGDQGILPISNTQKEKDRAERESLVLWRRPIQTLFYFLLQLVQLLQGAATKLLRKRAVMITLIALCVVYLVAECIAGPHHFYVAMLRQNIWFVIYWSGLGVLSTVGMGTGMHTFVLYLGPHIAAVTLAAYECKTINFPMPPYPDEIICPEEPYVKHVPSVWMILSKVRWEAFLWGIGTALGELPPYFMAKAARLSGYDLNEDNEVDSGLHELNALRSSNLSKCLTLVDRVKLLMKRMVEQVGFYGILACASIPNPLFDLAGITCGHFLVPFSTFFSATLIGKAIIKMHMQAIFVILAFNETIFDRALNQLSKVPVIGSILQQPFNEFLLKQKQHLHAKQTHGGTDSSSMLSYIFQLFTTAMLFCFFGSIINALAQSYCKSLQKKTRSQNAGDEVNAQTHLKQK